MEDLDLSNFADGWMADERALIDEIKRIRAQRDELKTACSSVLHILEQAWSNHEDGPILYQPREAAIIETLRRALGNTL